MKGDAMGLVKAPDEAATSGPMIRSRGWLSGATTWTSSPRVRSEAATSRPMKLAPTTTTRCAGGFGRNRPTIREGAEIVDPRRLRARDVQSHRLGARREQERTKLVRPAILQLDAFGVHVDQ